MNEEKKLYNQTLFSRRIGEPNPAPWSNYPPTPTGYDQQPNDPSNGNQAGIWGWISNNKMLATVVEKAKVNSTIIKTNSIQQI